MSDIPEKVVLITGASSGIGETTALEYAKLGYKVAIVGRNIERLEKVLDSLVANSPSKSLSNFTSIQADFENPADVDKVMGKTISKFGHLDILINNAGYAGKSRNINHEDFYEDFKNILQVNLMSATRLAQLATPYLLKSKGVIVNISSVADRLALPSVSYSVSKAGLSMLTKTLANAFDGTGVRVITVSPGPIITNIGPNIDKMGPSTSLNRVGKAIEVANTIVFLTSDKASFIHGCTVDIDGGFYAKFGGLFAKLQDIAGIEPTKLSSD